MATITFAITLAAPLLAGEPRQGNIYASYNFVPGSVVRGAVANILMAGWSAEEKRRPHPELCPDPATCSFCRVFYPRAADEHPLRPPRFFDCYPALAGGQQLFPFPQTVRTCKRYPGFKRANDRDERHGVLDTLIAQAAAQDAAQQPTPSAYQYALECPECAEALTPPKDGYYGRFDNRYYTAKPLNHRFSRTAINRQRHTAQAGQLFTLSVMGEQMRTGQPKPAPEKAVTRLQGEVDPGDADVDALRAALSQVNWLGSGSSRGLGQVAELKIATPTPWDMAVTSLSLADFLRQVENGRFTFDRSSMADLGQRLAGFNAAIAAERRFYAALGVDVLPGRWYFTLDLLSDTFVRADGLPALALTAAMLNLPGATDVFMAAAPVERGGWSNAWGLPRPRLPGIAAGGVFLLRVDTTNITAVQPLFQRLQAIEAEGIGADTARGAGRVLVCAPFHQEVTAQ